MRSVRRIFGLDDRKSVEAVIYLLDRTYEQAHAEQSAEDVLYDFCIAYLEQAKKQETLSEEDANKRLKVIVQWYAQHARTASGEQIIPEEAVKDIQDNWDEWLHGPEPLFSGLFRKKRREKHVSVDETSEEPAQEAPKAEEHHASRTACEYILARRKSGTGCCRHDCLFSRWHGCRMGTEQFRKNGTVDNRTVGVTK